MIMALQVFIQKITTHKCYYRALCLYRLFTTIDWFGEYKINIFIHCGHRKDRGHAWLTRNGKTFLIPNRTILPCVLEKIGENNRYIFWITT